MNVFKTAGEAAQRLVRAVGELPAFGTRKTRPPLTDKPAESFPVASDPMGDWYLSLPSKLSPTQVDSILRGALAGNIWQQTQLTQRMRDSWPMFAKCLHEVRDAVARVNYTVRPYCEDGEKPTPSAQAKAAVVAKAKAAYQPDRFADEDPFAAMLYDWGDAIANGISITQQTWHKVPAPGGGWLWLPRASSWVHPRHYGFEQDGSIGVQDQRRDDPLLFASMSTNRVAKDEFAFIVAKAKFKSGSPLGAGWMRPLAFYWIMVAYGREFALSFAQKFGGPFLDIPYKAGVGQDIVDRLEQIAKKALNMNYAVHPDSGEVKVVPGQSMAGDNPQLAIMRLADEACQLLLLGQTLTTSAPVNGGTRAQGEVHAGVRQEKIEGLAKWVGEILTHQWAASIVEANWGDKTECPIVAPDFTETENPMEAASRWSTIIRIGIPVDAEEAYQGLGIKQPQDGDKVIIGQEVGTLANTDGELSGQFVAEEQPGVGQPGTARATDAQLVRIKHLAVAAKAAPHQNGELKAMKAALEEINRPATRGIRPKGIK